MAENFGVLMFRLDSESVDERRSSVAADEANDGFPLGSSTMHRIGVENNSLSFTTNVRRNSCMFFVANADFGGKYQEAENRTWAPNCYPVAFETR